MDVSYVFSNSVVFSSVANDYADINTFGWGSWFDVDLRSCFVRGGVQHLELLERLAQVVDKVQ